MSTCTVVLACCACYTGARETLGVCARKCVVAAVVWVSTAVVLFFFVDWNCACSRSQTRGGFPPRAALFPKGELEHALRPHFAVQHLVSGRVGPEYSLLPPYRENTLTTGLSPLESLESLTQSGSDSRCHLSQTAPGRIPHLPAYASRGQNPNDCE